MNYNPKQLAAIQGAEDKKIIVAPAGSGKTATIIGALTEYHAHNPDKHIVAITFTRKASGELKERIGIMSNIEVSTIHSWSWRQLQTMAAEYGFRVSLLEDNAVKDILKNLCKKRRKYYVNQFQLFSYIMGNYNIDIDDSVKKLFEMIRCDYIKFKETNGLYDFTDLPKYLLNKLDEYEQNIYNIDALFVDEFQDIDPIQYKLFDRVMATKKCYIGDERQCQPAGARIKIRGGIHKNIEDVQIGDSVVYYDQSKGYMSGWASTTNVVHKYVTNKSSRAYCNDYIIHIKSENNLQSSYTSGHRTYVKLNNIGNKHVVYVMCDSQYRCRVGKIAIQSSAKENPWRTKMKNEKCEKIWLLGIYDTDLDARTEEAKISYQYGIPQICWQINKVQWTKERIDYIYQNINCLERLTKCLADYKLDIRYPLIDTSLKWSARNHCTTNSTIQIYAINIIPEYMSCLVYGSQTSHRNKRFENIINTDKEWITEPIIVYSLETESGNYVSDEIVTHNCIYAFRGSLENAFSTLDGFTTYELDTNYRSYQEILDYATTFRDIALDNVHYGEVFEIIEVDFINSSDIICARGNGGSVYRITHIGQCDNLVNKEDLCIDSLVLKSFLSDKKTQVLCRTNAQVKKLQALGIENVSTIHQAKGLEYDNVVLVSFPCNVLEEINVAYVGATRAKNNLCVIDFDIMLYIICNEDIKVSNKLF